MSNIYNAILSAIKNGKTIERLTDRNTGEEALRVDGNIVFGRAIENPLTEKMVNEPVLVLFGAGHVSKALYDLAVMQNMKTIVLDDRERELTETRFPFAERHVDSFENLLSKEYDVLSPYYVIFTHGHTYDLQALRYSLSHSFTYVGMIGSKRKSSSQIEQLRKEGFSEERLSMIHSPIGLSINAVTPEEIAISIMAEIVSVYRKDKDAVTIDEKLLKRICNEDNGIIARIIEKEGSAPRSVGSTMLIKDNETYSTIGGGRVESLTIEEARAMLDGKEERKILSYDLSDKGNAGMICGGSVKILLSRLHK